MARIVRSTLAERDLIDIWVFIAKDSPDAADRFLDHLAQKFDLLAVSPEIGRRREELAPRLRSFPVGRYIIFYRIAEEGIELVRVLSAYRDVDTLFGT